MLLQREIYIYILGNTHQIFALLAVSSMRRLTQISRLRLEAGGGNQLAVDGGGRQDDFSDLLRTGYRQAGRYRSW